MTTVLFAVAGFVLGFLAGFWVLHANAARKVEAVEAKACKHIWENGWRETEIVMETDAHRTIYDGLVTERQFTPPAPSKPKQPRGAGGRFVGSAK